MIEFQIKGLAELKAALSKLPAAIQSRVLRGMVSTGAAVIRQEAIQLAPEWTGVVSEGHPPPGTLKRAIYQTRLPELCTATREVWKVDVRKGKGKTVKGASGGQFSADAYYASWIEFGHYARLPKSAGKTYKIRSIAIASGAASARWVPAHPFMRPAFETQKEAASKAMGSYLTFKLADAAMFASGKGP